MRSVLEDGAGVAAGLAHRVMHGRAEDIVVAAAAVVDQAEIGALPVDAVAGLGVAEAAARVLPEERCVRGRAAHRQVHARGRVPFVGQIPEAEGIALAQHGCVGMDAILPRRFRQQDRLVVLVGGVHGEADVSHGGDRRFVDEEFLVAADVAYFLCLVHLAFSG